MNLEELKPCPFCGSGVLHRNNPEKMGRTFFVSCGLCDCRGACLPTEQGAVDAWNTRAIPDGYVVVPVEHVLSKSELTQIDIWRDGAQDRYCYDPPKSEIDLQTKLEAMIAAKEQS